VALYNRAMSIRDRYQYAFYDGLIIAAALEAGCDQLLSEDLQAGQRIEGLTIVNPFV
jgi:predicted nucleic acid-binding protein